MNIRRRYEFTQKTGVKHISEDAKERILDSEQAKEHLYYDKSYQDMIDERHPKITQEDVRGAIEILSKRLKP